MGPPIEPIDREPRLMNKVCASSSARLRSRTPFWLTGIALLSSFSASLAAVELSPGEAKQIGHKIWQNECDGTVAGLTSWNAGEEFASLGIGHFIWYPEGYRGPFEESFPPLVRFMKAKGREPLAFMLRACPWPSRARFLAAQQSPEMRQLREFLADTVNLQTQFLVSRLDQALPKLLAVAAPAEREKVRQNFERLTRSPAGCYALIDYVNFKGEGTLATERYQGKGWGLLQVLGQMPENPADPPGQFSEAAATVLRERVRNAPPGRHEERWLSGWIRRVNSYSRT